MSFDDPYDTLSFDEKLLSDKLNLPYRNPDIEPRPAISMERRIRDKLKESIPAKELVREPVVAGRDVPEIRPRESSDILDNRTLMFLVVVLSVFCLMQYMNQQAMANSIDQLLRTMCIVHVQRTSVAG